MLDDGGRCVCGQTQELGNPTRFRKCVIYTLTVAQHTLLQVQNCIRCPPIQRHLVGPDGRRSGFFNLNNSVLFTHDLLDDYTAAFTSSETPFVAWINLLRKRYVRHSSLLSFAHEAVFRAAWFASSSLQCLDGDMRCPSCGPSPDNVIWDGVSLSFHRKHVLSSLRPPTTIHPTSPIRESQYRTQTLIISGDLRRTMRNIILVQRRISALETDTTGSNTDTVLVRPDDSEMSSVPAESVVEDKSDLVLLVVETHKTLLGIDNALANLFYTEIGLKAIVPGKRHEEYAGLFLQVWYICFFRGRWKSDPCADRFRRLCPTNGHKTRLDRPQTFFVSSTIM